MKYIPIKNYEGLYEINKKGQIKSLPRRTNVYKNGQTHYVKGGIKKPTLDKNYYVVNLTKNGKRNRTYIHRLIAEHFIPNPNNYTDIDHIDRNSQNNHISNLRWVTESMNRANVVRKSMYGRGIGKTKFNKWTATIKFNKKRIHLGCFESQDEAKKIYNKKANEFYGKYAILNEL